MANIKNYLVSYTFTRKYADHEMVEARSKEEAIRKAKKLAGNTEDHSECVGESEYTNFEAEVWD